MATTESNGYPLGATQWKDNGRLHLRSVGSTALAEQPRSLIDLTDRTPGPDTIAPTATTAVVIPTLNEAANIVHVLPGLPPWVTEVILVDGGSTDGTVEAARSVRPDIIVVIEPKPGKGAALRAGFETATSDIVITLDADGSTDPAEIPGFVGLLLSGADLVKGSRFVQGGGTSDMGPLRKTGNWGLTRLVRALFGGKYTDLCYGYSAFWRRILPMLEGPADGFEIETFVNIRALKHGLKVVEVPSFESDRLHGQSNLRTFADGWRVLKTIVRERVRHTGPPVDHDVPVAPVP